MHHRSPALFLTLLTKACFLNGLSRCPLPITPTKPISLCSVSRSLIRAKRLLRVGPYAIAAPDVCKVKRKGGPQRPFLWLSL